MSEKENDDNVSSFNNLSNDKKKELRFYKYWKKNDGKTWWFNSNKKWMSV